MAGIQGALEADSSLLGGPLCAGVAGSATEPPVERVPALVTPEGLWCYPRSAPRAQKDFFFQRKMRLAWFFMSKFAVFFLFFSLLISFGGRKSVLYWGREAHLPSNSLQK